MVVKVLRSALIDNIEKALLEWESKDTLPYALYAIKHALYRDDCSYIRQYCKDGGTRTLIGSAYDPTIKELYIIDDEDGGVGVMMILCEREL